MEQEGQQPPLPSQGPTGQPGGYYGWQYDQDAQEVPLQEPPASPPPLYGAPPMPPVQPVYPPAQPGYPPMLPEEGPQYPPRYQEPIRDMGTSLGYGQSMEYQYSNAPQPSQPIPMLRQTRLQQLREERMRRQQRRVQQPDMTMIIQRKIFKRPGEGESGVEGGLASLPPQAPDRQPPSAPLNSLGQAPVPGAIPPTPFLQASPAETFVPRTPVLPPPALSGLTARPSPLAHNIPASPALQPASTVAQDTGMLQRVRVRNNTFILTGAFVASRVLGLLRTSMFAAILGTGMASAAYYQAFLFPDTVFNIVAGGALSSAFIPVFTKYMVSERDEKTAWHIASAALTLATALMVVIAVLGLLFANQIVPLYNYGVSAQQLALTTSLTRIMLFQTVVLGAGVIVSAVLNAQQNFTLYAVGTVLYNVGTILGLVPGVALSLFNRGQFAQNSITAAYFASAGIVLGAILQVGIQIPGLRRVGMRFKPSLDWRHPGVRQIAKQMVPRVVNAAMLSTSVFVDRTLLLLLIAITSADAVNHFITEYNQAFQLILLPLGIFGMSVSTAAFPTIAEYVARGRMDRVRGIILETLRSILFLSVPSCVGLIVLALPVIQALYQHGNYSLDSAINTTIPLAMFSIGLAGLAAVEILTRAFYALRDSTTPVIISVSQFILKIALGFVLIGAFARILGAPWGMGALALSTSLAGLLEAGVLFWLLHQRIGDLITRGLGIFAGRVLLASVVMGVIVFIVRSLLDFVLNTSDVSRPQFAHSVVVEIIVILFKLGVEILLALFIYLRAARLLKIEELGPVRRLLQRFKLSWI